MSHLAEFSRIDTEYLKQNRVGLLGGTFNPVHNGHLKMAYIALYEFGLGEIVFLPLGDPPHKRHDYLASAEHRLEMIRLAIAEEKRFVLCTAETDRHGFTYTVDTLELLTRAQPQTSFYYIIGADTLFELENWKNYERVFFLTDFICIMRPGHDQREVLKCADRLNNRFGHKIYIADERGPDISSSQIRTQICENKLSGGLVSTKVATYIIKHRVYNQEV
jgi:nicotinate-nucleotide adenylyltransferase